MAATQTTPGLFDFGVKREVVAIVPLSSYPGWIIRKFRDEYGRYTFGAVQPHGPACSPLEASWNDALYFVRHGEPVVR